MAFGYIIVAVLAASVVIFAFQNAGVASVRFLAWTLPETSIAAVMLAALAAGLLLAGIPCGSSAGDSGRVFGPLKPRCTSSRARSPPATARCWTFELRSRR